MDKLMVDLEFDEMDNDDDDDDVWDEDDEWLMASVTPPRATMTVSRTYEIDNLEYRHEVLTRKMNEVSDAEVANNISIREIHPIVATMEEQVQTLQTALHGAELQNQQLRTKVAEMESREGTMMSYMLWMEERLTVLEKRLLGPPPRPEVHEIASSFNIEEWEDIQARVEADKELIVRLQAEERENYTEAEKARMLVEFINKRKRYFVVQRAKEKRNKPPTQTQQKLETLKEEKEEVDGKLAGLLTASKDLNNLIKSHRSHKNKEGLGYSVVPPPIAQIYSSPKKDLSWTGLPEFAEDTITDYSRPSPAIESTSDDAQNKNLFVTETGASDSTILSKVAIKFVKAVDRAAERSTTTKVKAIKKSVRYAELYRKPLKKPNVRGNQRNWNNLKFHQLGPNFVMKNKACFNCCDFNHLAYDCRKRVKRGTSRS
nr:ubiquitin hydrolase [Tanacetum cinerariifolium]